MYELVFIKYHVEREQELSFPSKVFHSFYQSICMLSKLSQSHLCGCWCGAVLWFPCTCDARKRPCKMVNDSPAFMNHPCLLFAELITADRETRHVTFICCSKKDCYILYEYTVLVSVNFKATPCTILANLDPVDSLCKWMVVLVLMIKGDNPYSKNILTVACNHIVIISPAVDKL